MMRLAQRAAKKSMFTQHRVGAVIVKGNRVLSTGYNELTYSKFIGKPSVHAEERAVVKLLKEHRLSDLAGSTIYVSRFTKSGKLGVSRPCCRCSDLLRSVGVVRAFYTEDGGLVGEMRL